MYFRPPPLYGRVCAHYMHGTAVHRCSRDRTAGPLIMASRVLLQFVEV